MMSKSYSEMLAQKLCPEIKKSRNERRKKTESVDRATEKEISESAKCHKSKKKQQTDSCQAYVNSSDMAENTTVLNVQQVHELLSFSHSAKRTKCSNVPSSPWGSGCSVVPATFSQMPLGSSGAIPSSTNLILKIDDSPLPSATRVINKKNVKSTKAAGLLLTDSNKVDTSFITSSKNTHGSISRKDAGNFLAIPNAAGLITVDPILKSDKCSSDLVITAMKIKDLSGVKFSDVVKVATTQQQGGGITVKMASNHNCVLNASIFANEHTIPGLNTTSTMTSSNKVSKVRTTCKVKSTEKKKVNLAEAEDFTEVDIHLRNDYRLSSSLWHSGTDNSASAMNQVTDVMCDKHKLTHRGRRKKQKASALRKAAALLKAVKESKMSVVKSTDCDQSCSIPSPSDDDIGSSLLPNAANIDGTDVRDDRDGTVTNSHEQEDSCPENWEHRIVESPRSLSPEGVIICDLNPKKNPRRRPANECKTSGRTARVLKIRRCSDSSSDSERSEVQNCNKTLSVLKKKSTGSVESGCSSKSCGGGSACSMVSEASGGLEGNFGLDYDQACECNPKSEDIRRIDEEKQNAMAIFVETMRNGFGNIADLDTFDMVVLSPQDSINAKSSHNHACGPLPKTVDALDTFDDLPDCRDGFFVTHSSNTTRPRSCVNLSEISSDDQWTKVNRKAKKLVVSLESASCILGADGARLSDICRVTGANIEIDKAPVRGRITNRTFLINGSTEQIHSAYNLLTTLAKSSACTDRIMKCRRETTVVKSSTCGLGVDLVSEVGRQGKGGGAGDKPRIPMANASNVWYNRFGQCIFSSGSSVRRPTADATMTPHCGSVSEQQVLTLDPIYTDSDVQNSLGRCAGLPHKANSALLSSRLSFNFFESRSVDDRQLDISERRSSSVSRLPKSSGSFMPAATCTSTKTDAVIHPDADKLSSLTFSNGLSNGPNREYSLFSPPQCLFKSGLGGVGSILGDVRDCEPVVAMKSCQPQSTFETAMKEKTFSGSLAVQRPDSSISMPAKNTDSKKDGGIDPELLAKAPGYRIIPSYINASTVYVDRLPNTVLAGSHNIKTHIYDYRPNRSPDIPYLTQNFVESLGNRRRSSPPQWKLSDGSIPQNIALPCGSTFANRHPTPCRPPLCRARYRSYEGSAAAAWRLRPPEMVSLALSAAPAEWPPLTQVSTPPHQRSTVISNLQWPAISLDNPTSETSSRQNVRNNLAPESSIPRTDMAKHHFLRHRNQLSFSPLPYAVDAIPSTICSPCTADHKKRAGLSVELSNSSTTTPNSISFRQATTAEFTTNQQQSLSLVATADHPIVVNIGSISCQQPQSAASDSSSTFQNSVVAAACTFQHRVPLVDAGEPICKGPVTQPSPYEHPMVLPEIQSELNPFASDFVFDIAREEFVNNRNDDNPTSDVNSEFTVDATAEFNEVVDCNHVIMPQDTESSSRPLHSEYGELTSGGNLLSMPANRQGMPANHQGAEQSTDVMLPMMFQPVLLERCGELSHRKLLQFHAMHHLRHTGLETSVENLPSASNGVHHQPLVSWSQNNHSPLPPNQNIIAMSSHRSMAHNRVGFSRNGECCGTDTTCDNHDLAQFSAGSQLAGLTGKLTVNMQGYKLAISAESSGAMNISNPKSLVAAGHGYDTKKAAEFADCGSIVTSTSPDTFSKFGLTNLIGGSNDSTSFISSHHCFQMPTIISSCTEIITGSRAVVVSSSNHNQLILTSSANRHISSANHHFSFAASSSTCQSTNVVNYLPFSIPSRFHSLTTPFLASHISSSPSSLPPRFKSNAISVPSDTAYCDQVRSRSHYSNYDTSPSRPNKYGNNSQGFFANPAASFFPSASNRNGISLYPMGHPTIPPPILYADFPMPTVNDIWFCGSSSSSDAFQENTPSLWTGYAQPQSR